MSESIREQRGRLVRDAWVAAVLELIPAPKPSWLLAWDELDPADPELAFQREVDMRIGEAVAAAERERIRPALQDALEGLEDMLPYIPAYFREKWEHQGYIDRARAARDDLLGGGS